MVGPKLLLTEGVPTPVTFKVALAGLVVVTGMPPGPAEVNLPAGMVLIQFPGAVEVTLTATVQEPGVDPVCAGTVPPLKVIVDVPAVAVAVPPQLFDARLTIVIFVGKLSVHAAFVN